MKKPFIKRDEFQYLDIEQFNTYELTNCIAFEMAIRNKEVFDCITTAYNKYNTIKKNLNIKYHYILEESIFYKNISLENIFILEKEYYEIKILINLLTKIEENYFIHHAHEYENILKKYNFVSNVLPKKIIYNQNSKKNIFYSNLEDNFFKHFKNTYKILGNHQEFLFNKFYRKDKQISYINENKAFKIKKIKTFNPKLSHRTPLNIGFAQSLKKSNYERNEILKSENEIEPNFARPLLKPNYKKNKYVNLNNINLALPEEELIAYIKLIKNSFENNDNLIKTPYELFENKLFKTEKEISTKNGKKINAMDNILQTKNKLTKNLKLADLFYGYDAIKVGMRQKDILNELDNYYHNEHYLLTERSKNTLKLYHEIAIEYIDNLKYKDLITGFTEF